jgi:Na+-driven multidrug efflux pump
MAAAGMAAGGMLLAAMAIYVAATALMRIFTSDAAVIVVGVEYLRVVVISFAASGITFVSSSMFQAMGNTMPSLATSGLRLLASVIPAILLSRMAGFHLTWIWYTTAVAVFLQMTANVILLQREFRLKLV